MPAGCYVRTEEHNRKIGDAQRGEKNHNYGKSPSIETRLKRSISLKGHIGWLRGKHLSEGHKERIRKANMGNKYSLGKKWSEETRLKQRKIHSGERNASWKGGISFEPYTIDFSNTFKERIRERDNYCCVICNTAQEQDNYKLCVHHIDYNKLNSFPQNCVSLCRFCHVKTNINRLSWTIFFQNLLKERYGHQYTQDQKILLEITREEN
jgi:hypothetical protein